MKPTAFVGLSCEGIIEITDGKTHKFKGVFEGLFPLSESDVLLIFGNGKKVYLIPPSKVIYITILETPKTIKKETNAIYG